MEPFLKTIYPSAYGYSEPLAALVDVHSHGIDSAWMNKRAAAGIFKSVDIRPDPGHSILHLIAMGATGRYGLNRNGDGFLRKSATMTIPFPKPGAPSEILIHQGLQETHDTFEKLGHVFRHHKNKDPKKKEGDILKSAYHDAMDRVELLIKVSNDKWASEINDLANDKDVSFSMSTHVPFDVCTYCGNQARNRKEYCDHSLYEMGTITKEGHQVGVMNDWMKFFDISQVTVPADRIALGLLKAASGTVKSGAELAEDTDLFPPDALWTPSEFNKRSILKKLSDIEKEIEAVGMGDSPINQLACSFHPEVSPGVDDDTMSTLSADRGQIMDVLGSLADAKISLSIKDFLRLILGKRCGEAKQAVGEAEMLVPGIFTRMLNSPCNTSDLDGFGLGRNVIPFKARQAIHGMGPGHSFDGEPVQRRMTITVLRGNHAPKLLGPVELEKQSSSSELAARLVRAYALYKCAFCQRAGLENSVLTKLAVLQHYAIYA